MDRKRVDGVGRRWLVTGFAAAVLTGIWAPDSQGAWEEVWVDDEVTVGDRTYQTGCALDEAAYRYFIRPGSATELLVFLNGGGACWDPNTCGLTPGVPTTIGGPLVTESVDGNGGLVDFFVGSLETGVLADRPDNPFDHYTKVYLPYCTGDIFWGNKDHDYGPAVIRHRGYGNLLAVLESLWAEQGYEATPPNKIVISGISAGGYGAVAAFVEVEKRLPRWRLINNQRTTQTYLLADSANAILVQDFLDRAINGPDAAWGVRDQGGTLPPYLLSALNQAPGLPVRMYQELAWRHPKSRFGQFQNAYDLVQGGFLNTMQQVEAPERWADPTYLLPALAQWTLRMRAAVNLSATAPNYRYYTAAGSEHMILIDVPFDAGFGFCTDLFYDEDSAAGVRFADWVSDMINRPSLLATGEWRNASCFPGCLDDPQSRCPIALVP